MKNRLIFFILIVLSSCARYVQICELGQNKNCKEVNNQWVYENDTVRIEYDFWQEGGILRFSIYNKLNVPIYIDWKKSSYIRNSLNSTYWIDKTQIQGTSTYSYKIPNKGNPSSASGMATYNSLAIHEERISTIAPSAGISISHFVIDQAPYLVSLPKNTDSIHIAENSKKQFPVYYLNFTSTNTPLIFRNFLTLSLNEDFQTEFYIDNRFYISKIQEMSRKQLFKSVRSLESNDFNIRLKKSYFQQIRRSNTMISRIYFQQK